MHYINGKGHKLELKMSVNKNIAPLRHAYKHQQVQQQYRLRRLPSAKWLVAALPLKWTAIKEQVSHTITYGENMVTMIREADGSLRPWLYQPE